MKIIIFTVYLCLIVLAFFLHEHANSGIISMLYLLLAFIFSIGTIGLLNKIKNNNILELSTLGNNKIMFSLYYLVPACGFLLYMVFYRYAYSRMISVQEANDIWMIIIFGLISAVVILSTLFIFVNKLNNFSEFKKRFIYFTIVVFNILISVTIFIGGVIGSGGLKM